LTGGCDHTGQRYFDTWELNPLSKSGAAGVLKSFLPADVDPCYASMAYDEQFREMVLSSGRVEIRIIFGSGTAFVLFGGLNQSGFFDDTWTWGKQVACVSLEGAEVPVGTELECFFTLGTGAQIVRWDADGFSPKRETNTTARFHTNGPGPAVVRVTWTDEEGEQSTEMRFTVIHRSK
jgi:hypothetical protein